MLQFFINCLFITQYISFTNEMNYVSTWNHVNFLNTDIALNSSSSFQASHSSSILVLSDFFRKSSLIKLGYNFLGKARNENNLGNWRLGGNLMSSLQVKLICGIFK